MKSDKEFLEGVYQKAEILKKEKTQKEASYKNYIRYSSVAALFIIIPLLFFSSRTGVPNNEVKAPEHRLMNINYPVSSFYEADYILIGETQDIKKIKSKTDVVEIIISIDRVFLGEINGATMSLQIPSDISSEFKKGDRNLLFLYKDENDIYNLINESDGYYKESDKDVYVDSEGNKYGLEDIENKIKGED